jgi:hypothetical protein
MWAVFTRPPVDGEGDGPEIARFDDIVAMSASFALNTIPTASLIVAVGTKVDGSNDPQPATIHKVKKLLEPRDKVVVTLEVLPGSGDTEKLRPGRYVVFDGFYVGIGYQRSTNQANYVLNLVHWLDDLNNSSAINGNWFPNVPFDYAQQAVYDRLENDNIKTGVAASPRIARTLATQVNLKKDLWGEVIKPIFLQIGGYTPGGDQSRQPVKDSPLTRNDAAVRALKRMPGAAENYVPLTMALTPESNNFVGSITTYFEKTVGESFAQNSFWGKLIAQYAADFLFAISPAVDWALPIPFCGGVRWVEGGPVIKASEYSYANFGSNVSQVVESVNIYYSAESNTAVGVETAAPDRKLSFYAMCAEYPAKDAITAVRGLKLFKEPPGWAVSTSPARGNGWNSSDNNALTTAPGGNARLASGFESISAIARKMQPLMRQYAKHWYMSEILQQRYGELSGPLRFDIAPGSIVKIETPIRDRERETDNENLYASVMSVTFAINADKATAGTSFSIAHTRTQEELAKDYSTDFAPLYSPVNDPTGTRWLGGPLAKPIS